MVRYQLFVASKTFSHHSCVPLQRRRTTNNGQTSASIDSQIKLKQNSCELTGMRFAYRIAERTCMSAHRTRHPNSGRSRVPARHRDPMKRELITKLHGTLEKLVHKETASGTEFWLARDLQKVLGYVSWA